MKIGVVFFLVLLSTLGFAQERFRSGILLHHSTGGMIWESDSTTISVPNEITTYNSDHGFTGDQSCSMDEKWYPNFGTSMDNEWNDWRKVFNNETTDDIYAIINSNKIVVIKSCYPSSAMTGWGAPADTLTPTVKSVYNYKWHWRYLLKIMEKYPDNFFVIWTNVPLIASSTNDTQALFSHRFCTWAKDTLALGLDPEYGKFPKNVYVFDYFHKIAGDDYKVNPDYAYDISANDGHPNAAATEFVAPQFVKEIFDAAIAYENFYNNVLQPPVLTSPSDNSEDVSLDETLRWESVPDAVSYRLQVSTASDFNSTLLENESTNTYYTFSVELSQQAKYFWRVKSLGNSIESDWSDGWSFSTTTATSIENSTEDIFELYPNPTSGKLNISVSSSKCFCDYLEVNVYNIIGQLVKSISFKDLSRLPIHIYLNNLPKGQYFINLISNNIKRTKKIVIIK